MVKGSKSVLLVVVLEMANHRLTTKATRIFAWTALGMERSSAKSAKDQERKIWMTSPTEAETLQSLKRHLEESGESYDELIERASSLFESDVITPAIVDVDDPHTQEVFNGDVEWE